MIEVIHKLCEKANVTSILECRNYILHIVRGEANCPKCNPIYFYLWPPFTNIWYIV